MGEGPTTIEPEDRPSRRACVPDPLIPPLNDPNHLVDLIAEITGRPKPEVVERLRREEADLGVAAREDLEHRGLPNYVWSDELAQFYEQTDAFLFESLVWNVTRHKNLMRRWIAEFLLREFGRPVHILMYGDGLGIDSFYLTQAGHRVESFEVSQACVQFAEAIFATGEIDVRIHRALADVPTEQFDVLICLDVLEHVPDPPALVKQLCEKLRPGGLLIVHAPFFYVHPAVCTHLRSNRRYSGDIRRLYHPAGLKLAEGRLSWDPIVLRKSGDHTSPPPRSRWRPWLLRMCGLFLAVGRYWSTPHCLIAHRLTRVREIYLTEGL
jgi:SAM-dependent methyltransferase